MIGLSLPEWAAVGYLLFLLRVLFTRYQFGEIFSSANAELMYKLGKGLVALALVKIASIPFKCLLLSAQLPKGMGKVEIKISSEHLYLLCVAFVIFILSWVHSEANRLNEEVAGTI